MIKQKSNQADVHSAVCHSVRFIVLCSNNIPDWLKTNCRRKTSKKLMNYLKAQNNMPEVCGRICPQDRLCEGNCVIEQIWSWNSNNRVCRKIHYRKCLEQRMDQTN